LNGRQFYVGKNLHLALLHLRSPTHSLPLWVDAICVNQKDTKERNEQVALMSFIYTRAQMVVAWLGVKDYNTQLDPFRSMSMDWKSGQIPLLAASLAGITNFHSSPEPDYGTLVRIAKSSYWTRLWTVQESYLPRLLVYVYGSRAWLYDDLQRWEVLKAVISKPAPLEPLVQAVDDYAFGAMFRLLDARKERYSDSMRLSSLIERFAHQACTEPRDRVYSLLVLANDGRPISGGDGSTHPVEGSLHALVVQAEGLKQTQRRARPFRVNYSRSFYGIWTDVMEFFTFQAMNIEGRLGENIDTPYTGIQVISDSLPGSQWHARVVRTAGIVQEALG
jgi:hypothetical protein